MFVSLFTVAMGELSFELRSVFDILVRSGKSSAGSSATAAGLALFVEAVCWKKEFQ
jgi:hypothetical protein